MAKKSDRRCTYCGKVGTAATPLYSFSQRYPQLLCRQHMDEFQKILERHLQAMKAQSSEHEQEIKAFFYRKGG